MKVFIVEDAKILQEKLAGHLEEMSGFTVVGTAAGADEAVKAICRLKPDVIILDIRLRSGSGIDVLKRIRSDSYRPIVIVFTQYPFLFYRKTCLSEGARFFFDKTTEFERMLDTLKKLQETGFPEGKAGE